MAEKTEAVWVHQFLVPEHDPKAKLLQHSNSSDAIFQLSSLKELENSAADVNQLDSK